jgi:hypothetical protein
MYVYAWYYRVRDEDEWSDEEPDAFLQAKQHLLNPARASGTGVMGQGGEDGYLEEDSLMQEHDDYGRLDDEMELELFGRVQRSPEVVRTGGANKGYVHHAPPAQQAAVGVPREKASSGRSRDVDDAKSDCSELTADSMDRTSGRQRSAGGNARSNVPPAGRTPVPPPGKRVGSASKVPRPIINPQPTASTMDGAKYSLPRPAAFPLAPAQNTAVLPQVQFASSFAVPVLAPVAPVLANKQGSEGTPSPTRSKGKPVYRKLKPIPLSQPYRPVPTAAGVHDT